MSGEPDFGHTARIDRGLSDERRSKLVLDADISELVAVGQLDPVAPETAHAGEQPERDMATFARGLLGVILAGRNGEGYRRRAMLLAFRYAPSLVWPIQSNADLARALKVTPAAITKQLATIEDEIAGVARK